MTYLVNLDFKRGPSFAIVVSASSEQEAIDFVRREAPQYGFDQPVKKAKAIPQ